MKILIRIALSIFFILKGGLLLAEPPYPAVRFDHLSVQHGLSQSSVISIWQDRYGLMWLGTRDGLNLYDGYQFKTFKNSHKDSSSLASNVINHMGEDQQGNLWLATEKGLSRYDRRLQTFTHYQINAKSPEIRYVLADSKERLWVASNSGIHLFDPEQQTFRLPDFSIPHADAFTDHSATVILESRNGTLWAGMAHYGLVGFDEASNQLIHLDSLSPNLRLSELRIEALEEDQQGHIWIGTKEGGLFRIHPTDRSWLHFSTKAKDEKYRLSHNNARALVCDPQGNLWIGTFDGLDLYDAHLQEIIHFKYQEGNPHGLSHGSVRSLYVDRKGSVWIGTYFGGVNIYDQDNQRFQHYFHIPGNEGSLSFNVVGAFTETADQQWIIGTERGGINKVDPNTGTHQVFTHIPGDPQSLAGNTIKSLYTDTQGRIWVGLFRNGLNRFDPESGKATHFPLAEDPLHEELRYRIVNSIAEDKHGHLWIGMDGKKCLRKFDPEQERFVDFHRQEEIFEQLGDVSLKHIHIDRLGNLWLSTRGNGLLVFNESQGVVAHFHHQSPQFPLPLNAIASVFEDSKGQIWVSSVGGGILQLDAATKNFRIITTEEGLANNTVYGIKEDASGYLWCFTLSGISRIKPDDFQINSYTYTSGFPLEELNEGAFYSARQGEMLVGGSNGYVYFHPEHIRDNEYIPPVLLTRLMVSNQEIFPGSENPLLQQSLQETQQITLNYFHTMISLEFAALSYFHSENNQYAYMLEGFDDEWIYNGSNRRATYTNLQEGEYVFKVRGSNNDGLWNEEAAVLAITVLPPPWKSWWAYLIYTFLIISGFLFIRYNALKGAQLKHDLRLQQLEKEKWKEIHRLKLEYFTEVSHEFRTPLTLIVSPLENLIDNKEGSPTVRKQLKIMYYNCRRLLLLIDQILELRRIESQHSRLELKPNNLSLILTQVIDSFKSLADQLNIKLALEDQLPEQWYYLDKDKLEKILFNLLYNAFKFTAEGDSISVKAALLQKDAQTLIALQVADSGKGIAESDIGKIFNRFYSGNHPKTGTGIGLSMVKSLIELMAGSINVESKVGKGSVFKIELPLEAIKNTTKVRKEAADFFVKPLPVEYEAVFKKEEEEELDQTSLKDLILIVEDQADLRQYLKEHLSNNYEVLTAGNGVKALEKAKVTDLSLLICDIMMPEMDGFALLQRIRTDVTLSHIPVLMLTAKSSDQDRLRGLESGADAYLTKPFMLKELDQRIHNILSQRRKLHQYFRQELQFTDKTHGLSSQDEKLMKKIREIVEQQLSEPQLNVAYLGKEVGLSRVHLYRKMKALTGIAPADYIRNYRIKKASTLLSSGQYKIAEVAYHVGFQDVNYFSKCFKKSYGMSPSDWIELHRQNPGYRSVS